jgi:hypothetical protein
MDSRLIGILLAVGMVCWAAYRFARSVRMRRNETIQRRSKHGEGFQVREEVR